MTPSTAAQSSRRNRGDQTVARRFTLACACLLGAAFLLTSTFSTALSAGPQAVEGLGETVSFSREVFPILQSQCLGCHQPAKPSGDYVMTSFSKLLAGGESGSAAVVPGDPDGSYLVQLITPTDGQADMPSGKPPLDTTSIDLIRRWIQQGAEDDSPQTARMDFDINHPPTYSSLPVVTCLAGSPDGRLLAVSGYHEVLLHKADGSGLVARLIGRAERIQSVAFSPDGTKLAVTGGLPARGGELQIWDVAAPKEGLADWQASLLISVPVTHDTIHGGRWSPDGKIIAVGCADNTLRAFDAATGDQVLFQGAHNDWVLDTVFSTDGSHLISVSRDMTAKLTEVSSERFVDNITSITPGALKGGILAVARHPQRDEIVIGGSDGVPMVYRVFRQTERRIGDDANLIRRLQPLPGRVFSVAVSGDGRRIAAGSSLDGTGRVTVDSYEFDTALPDDVKQIMSKVSTSRSVEEIKRLEQYTQEGVHRIAQLDLPTSVYAVTFLAGDAMLAAAGSDGVIRLIDAQRGNVEREFPVVPDLVEAAAEAPRAGSIASATESAEVAETLPHGAEVVALEVEPEGVQLTSIMDYAQLLVTATLSTGQRLDGTRMASFQVMGDAATVAPRGVVRARGDGEAEIRISLGGSESAVSVSVQGLSRPLRPDFLRDVAPVIAKMGCNQGTCHGAAEGRNGFKLSLRGYDAIADVRALTDDLASRRANLASPENSLMLLKATSAVPHMGGQLTRTGEDYYELLRHWLAGGAKLNMSTPAMTSIAISPENPTIDSPGARQQVRVVATFADGQTRDVTREAFVTSGNTEVATAGQWGLLTAVRRGEAPLLARYQGAYAATTLTVMGDRSGFVWQDPPVHNRIDELVAAKWQRLKLQPAPLCSDTEFLRRVSLDLTGLPPTAEAASDFLSDPRESRVKREEMVDRLIGSDTFIDYWTNKWADLLQVHRKYLGPEGAAAYRNWIRTQIAENRPYDEFVRSVLIASGSNREHPPASYYKILRTPEDRAETTTQLFLAIRFNCNKCHDHPFERWTQDQYYQTASYFSQVALEPDPASNGQTIGGSDVEQATPLYELVTDDGTSEVVNERSGQPATPAFPFTCRSAASENGTRRQQLTAWLTSPDNPYFARSYVNRLWGYLLGVGIIEPIDDIRAGNPPTNPQLLDYLTQEFIAAGFDTRHVLRLICTSRTYQLSVATNHWNEDDRWNYAHALARRLPAEVLFDAVHQVTGSVPKIPGVPVGTRAMQLPDAGITLPSGFLSTLGRPPRESACECERVSEIQLGPIMAMISGPVVAEAIADPQNALTALVSRQTDDRALVDEVFLRILNRPAGEEEVAAVQQLLAEIETDHQQLLDHLRSAEQAWSGQKLQLDAERREALAKAERDLQDYEEQIAPDVVRREQEQAVAVAQAAAAVADFESRLEERFEHWAGEQTDAAQWYPLRPHGVTASNGARFTLLEDRSIQAQGNAEKGTYTVTFHTHLPNITGIRLEALSIEGIAGGGPGLAENGNFVVTQFEVLAGDVAAPTSLQSVALQQPLADFTQQGFDVGQVLDGAAQDQLGWAIAPAGGTVHWATFQMQEPIVRASGTVLQVIIHQFHEAKDHRLGRFRISVTNQLPIGLGLPESLAAIRATPSEARSEAQQTLVADYLRKSDAQYRQLQEALATSRRPLPIDPGIQQRRATIEELRRDIPDDPALVQMRKDAAESTRQIGNRRLTAIQDLAWALINSPAFLFNH